MCGLVGLWCWDTPIDRPAVNRALDRLQHRGPDGTGLWISGDARVALGHTRLSIIDLATGEQPLHHPNDRIHLVVNGEFYDYERIRDELTARGWTRTLRLARTIADLEGADTVRRVHVAEALIYRRVAPGSVIGSPAMAG